MLYEIIAVCQCIHFVSSVCIVHTLKLVQLLDESPPLGQDGSIDDQSSDALDPPDDSDKDSDYQPNERDLEDDLADELIVNDINIASTPSPVRQQPETENLPSSGKRKRIPMQWNRNIKSVAYNAGKFNKKSKQPCQVKQRCNCKRKKCSAISDEERQALFNAFWVLGTQLFRQNYIVSHARKTKKLRAKPGSRRGDPVTYHLTDAEGRDNAVCENFFLNTLNISKQAIHWNLKRANNGTVQKPPKRIPHNKVGEEVIQSIKSHHIESTN